MSIKQTELTGHFNQVFYDVYVESETRFHDFEFDGYTYHYVKEQMKEGIGFPEYAIGYYAKEGFEVVSESFMEDGETYMTNSMNDDYKK